MTPNTRPTILQYAMKTGIFTGLAMVCYSLLLYLTGQSFNITLNFLSIAIPVGFMSVATKNYRDNYQNGYISFGNAFAIGFLIAAFAGIISGFFSYVTITLIDPELTEKGFVFMEEKLLNKGVSEDQVEALIEASRENSNPAKSFILGIFGSAFFGAIIALIIAAIMKREASPFEITDNGITNPD